MWKLWLWLAIGWQGPVYSPATLVNAAHPRGGLAPNTFATIYGTNLALATRAMQAQDLQGDVLPTVLPGTSTRVLVRGEPAPIWYASPNQINFLIPPNFLPGPADIQVTVAGRFGVAVEVTLDAEAPVLFQLDPDFVLAVRLDGSLITRDRPAKAGDEIVLFATGLGATNPPTAPGRLMLLPAALIRSAEVQVRFNDRPALVRYVGAAPGFAGLYQINVRLPDVLGSNAAVRIAVGDRISPTGPLLPAP